MDIACPTCLNPFTMNCDISVTHCGHLFHTNCISKWIETGKKTCPQCRKSCTLKKLIKLYLPATGNVKKRDAIQADLDRAESEAKRLKSEMAKKDEVYKSMHEWMFKNNPSNASGTTLLHWAAANEQLDIFRSIIEHGLF